MNLVIIFYAFLQAPVRRSRTTRAAANLQLQVASSGYMRPAILHIDNYKTFRKANSGLHNGVAALIGGH
jgi:hypothetical protein